MKKILFAVVILALLSVGFSAIAGDCELTPWKIYKATINGKVYYRLGYFDVFKVSWRGMYDNIFDAKDEVYRRKYQELDACKSVDFYDQVYRADWKEVPDWRTERPDAGKK